MHIVVGTAGHIDHGKTALVKALTGTDTDRLPEEKQRGITIDLGFAEFRQGDVQIGFVDVPGHERFVKNMLAGASGIDLVMLVVAADEGVMPQTREHLDICRLLRIPDGIVVLTKTDLADAETLELARLDVSELVKDSFMENAPVFEVSAKTGAGIEKLKQALFLRARNSAAREHNLIARLPIDRSFAVRGFGSVVTGTLASGTIREADELELLPEGRKVRVRGIQTHGRSTHQAEAGQRTAVNLGGIDYEEIHRGMTLSEPGVLKPAQIFDAEVEVLADAPWPLRSRQRLRVHLGTAEVLARLAVISETGEIGAGASGFAQLRLESPVAAVSGERFILRSYSPQTTIGGGTILRPAIEKPGRKNILKHKLVLREISEAFGDDGQLLKVFVKSAGEKAMSAADIRSITGWTSTAVEKAVSNASDDGTIVDAAGVLIDRPAFEALKSPVLAAVDQHHKMQPLSRGLPLGALRESVFQYLRPEIQKAVIAELENVGELQVERDVVKLRSYSLRLSPAEQEIFEGIRSAYETAGLEVPKLEDVLSEIAREKQADRSIVRKVFQLFLNSGEIVGVSQEFYFPSTAMNDLTARLRKYAETTPARVIDVPAFKELAGVSRKYAIPLLEYFDREQVTARRGNKRIIL